MVVIITQKVPECPPQETVPPPKKPVVLPEGLPKLTPRLNRDQAAAYLTAMGLEITNNRLAKLAMKGDGPRYKVWGNRAVYTPEELLEWAEARGGEVKENTSQ